MGHCQEQYRPPRRPGSDESRLLGVGTERVDAVGLGRYARPVPKARMELAEAGTVFGSDGPQGQRIAGMQIRLLNQRGADDWLAGVAGEAGVYGSNLVSGEPE